MQTTTQKTVWEFRSIDDKQVVRAIRCAEPNDLDVQHEYQKVIYRGFDLAEISKAVGK